MAIDITSEGILSLTDATRALPALDGRRVHPSTVFRWITSGVRGVKLEGLRLGRRICTSRQALTRFAQALAERDAHPEPRAEVESAPAPVPIPKRRTERQKLHDMESAERRLASVGV